MRDTQRLVQPQFRWRKGQSKSALKTQILSDFILISLSELLELHDRFSTMIDEVSMPRISDLISSPKAYIKEVDFNLAWIP